MRFTSNTMATEYFTGKEFFITGGSGVLGKGIIEKLLRSTDVGKIYMLLRSKRNITLESRMDDIKKGAMFDRLRVEKPSALDKLIPIAGDICEPMLGLTEESLELIKNVEIVINSAATIRFDEPLRDAIRKNVGGTLECCKVAQKIKKLKLFVHVSTYFSNPNVSFIKNEVYPPPVAWKQALRICDSEVSDDKLNALLGKYIGDFPNTYTFTKNLAESVANDFHSEFPVMITRPSVILCARFEPFPGYVEKLQGVTGIVVSVGTGLSHSLYAKPHAVLDVVWADLVVNVHLLSIARVGLMKEKLTKPEVVLICGYPYDTFDFNKRFEWIVRSQKKHPFAKCFGRYSFQLVPCYYHYVLRFLLYQVVPSVILDGLLMAFKMKPMIMKGQRKLFVGSKELEHFTSRTFKSGGITNIADLVLLTKDSTFDVHSLFQQTNDLSIGDSYEAFMLGNRKYLMNEDESSLPAARRRYKMIEYAFLIKDVVFYILLIWLFFKYFLL